MRLPEVLDLMQKLFEASEHPDIVKVERYGDATELWGPRSNNFVGSISGVKLTYTSTSTAMLWGAIWPGETAVQMPAELPPIADRVARISILAVQLLDVARPAQLRSWQLVALPDVGSTEARGATPAGVSLVGADGAKILLRASSTGATVGDEPKTDPFPDYRVPATMNVANG